MDSEPNTNELEAAVKSLAVTGMAGLADVLEAYPERAAEALTQYSDTLHEDEIQPELSDIASLSEEEVDILTKLAVGILVKPSNPVAESLGELRAKARLTVEDVAEKFDLPVETIDLMEEDTPIINTPMSLLCAFGDLFGYSPDQINVVLAAQGSFGIATASYMLNRGTASPDSSRNSLQSLTFAEVLEASGATENQKQRWLLEDSESRITGDCDWDDFDALKDELFA